MHYLWFFLKYQKQFDRPPPSMHQKKTFEKFVCNYKVEKNTKLERFWVIKKKIRDRI